MVVEHDAGGHRRHLDDRAALGHMAQQRLEVLEGPGELDRVHPVQVFLAVFEKGLKEPPAGRIDSDIEPAEPFRSLGYEIRDLGLRGDIANQPGDAKRIGNGRQRIGPAPRHQNPGPVFDITPGDGLADIAGRNAQHQCRLTLQSLRHGLSHTAVSMT
ncbi:hypothetical protein D3C78_1177880 [compost metagenome]